MRLLLRRWYVVVLGVGLTAAMGQAALERPPVHYAQFEVVVLPPLEPVNPNSLHDGPYEMTPMAGVLVSDYNAGERPLQMATSSTTLYGEGVHSGHLVRLRNHGTQWQPVYQAPVIDVQVVGDDPAEVEQEAAGIAARLDELLWQRQDDLGIRPSSRMTTEKAPADPVVYEVSGSRTRTAVGILALGGVLTALAACGVDRVLARRRRAPIPPMDDPATGPVQVSAGSARLRS